MPDKGQPDLSLFLDILKTLERIDATVAIAVLGEVLVGAVEPVVEALGLIEFFISIIIIPLVGNVAEHLVAVEVAIKNKMELSLSVSLGSRLLAVYLIIGLAFYFLP